MKIPQICIEIEKNEDILKNENKDAVDGQSETSINSNSFTVSTEPKLSLTFSRATEKSDQTTTADKNVPWIKNQYAKNYFISLISVFYAVIIIIYGVALEFTYFFNDKTDKVVEKAFAKDYVNYNYYMFVTSFIFFAYCYILLLLKPRRWGFLNSIKQKFGKSGGNFEEEKIVEKFNAMPNVGSLFLRLGAVVFAIVSLVYFAYSASLNSIYLPADICSTIFVIFQTHFVFCSSKMFDPKHHITNRFGTMHLVAVNVYNWFQFVFTKSASTQDSLGKVYKANKTVYIMKPNELLDTDSSEETVGNGVNNYTVARVLRAAASTIINENETAVQCKMTECYFGSFTKVLYTGIVEYSLIAAAVMFIVWQNIEKVQERQLVHQVQKKNTVRIGCSKTIYGLFAGFAFLAGTIVSMALFYGANNAGRYYYSSKVFNATDLIQHCIAIAACLFAFWRIRLLNYIGHDSHSHHAAHANQELLDIILLAIGLIGELSFSITALVGICNTGIWTSFSETLVAAHISRIVQSILQCCLICMASKLKVINQREQPGKQAITFLIFVNVAIFIINLFESDKVGISEAVVNYYGKENWAFLVRTFSPLTIFFRFHSSVCLAEIWKSTYAAASFNKL